jgi:hypothetical protein
MRGSARTAPDPSPFGGVAWYRRTTPSGRLCLAEATSWLYCWKISRIGQGDVLNRALPRIRIAAALAAVAILVAGCAAANNPASSQGEQPYKTAYGLSSAGTTTDLYTEIFGPNQPTPAPATTVAAAQPAQPVAQPITPAQQPTTSSGAVRPGQAANRQYPPQTAANRAPPPPASVQPAPVQVAQQPAPPPAPQEPDVPTVYGITANGPTTDLYTAIFGPRRSDGQ